MKVIPVRLLRMATIGTVKEGMPIIVYGVMTDQEGRPVAVEVYPGNTADPATIIPQVEKLRGRFGLSNLVLVGDHGMLTQTRIDTLREYPGIGWISALKSHHIRKLVEGGDLQLSLFIAVTLWRSPQSIIRENG